MARLFGRLSPDLCDSQYGIPQGSQAESGEGNMEKKGTTMKAKRGPLLGSRVRERKIPESNKAEQSWGRGRNWRALGF